MQVARLEGVLLGDHRRKVRANTLGTENPHACVCRKKSRLAIGIRIGRHVQTSLEGRLRKINFTYRSHLRD